MPTEIELSNLELEENEVIKMSIKENVGIKELKEKIIELYDLEEIENKDLVYLTNARSISILKECLNKISEVESGIENNLPIDILELDIKAIWEELGKINGTTYEEELLDEMFKRFCLGK